MPDMQEMAARRRSFSRSSKDDTSSEAEQVALLEKQAAEKARRRREAGRRFSVTGMVDLAAFADVDASLPPERKLQQVMSQAKETGLKVDQIFAYFKPEGAAAADDITPADFGLAMNRLGWAIEAPELAA